MANCLRCNHLLIPGKVKCTSCGQWNPNAAVGANQPSIDESVLLEDITSSDEDRMKTGWWDACFGTVEKADGTQGPPGIVRGSTNLIAGAPGAGKSTMFLQMSANVIQAFPGEVLYMAAEEQLGQIRARANRLKLKTDRRLRFLDLRKGVSDMAAILRNRIFSLLIIDSLKAIAETDEEQIAICKVAKEYATFMHAPAIISHHVNKGEEIAGLMSLQHEVDATMTFFPIPEIIVDEEAVRELETRKNRNGKAWVRRYFHMTSRGLVGCENPYDKDDEDEEDEEDDEELESKPNPRITRRGKNEPHS